jgi:hypothetical protein
MMTKIYAAVESFIDRVKPQPLTVEVEGEHYKVQPGQHGLAVGDHIRKPAPIVKHTLELQTLTGFVAAYKAKIDNFPDTVAVHVIDHRSVALRSLEADEFGRRHSYLFSVNGEQNPFRFDQYMIPEDFLIALQSGFLPTDDVIKLQRLASSLTSESSVGVQDDGLSQTITVRQGAVTRQSIDLPPRIRLFAYRTFREISPVESEFMVRLQGEPGKLPKIALPEVDAGRWKLDTMTLIARWLTDNLPDGAIVIA